MDKKEKDQLKECLLYRWDSCFDKKDWARKVVNAELNARTALPWAEECELGEELVQYLLSKR